MFCPECQGEYRNGIYRCVDCGVELVCEQPKEQERDEVLTVEIPNDELMVEVFNTTELAVDALAKSLLISTGMPYESSSDRFQPAEGRTGYWILVPASRAKEAKELLIDLPQKATWEI